VVVLVASASTVPLTSASAQDSAAVRAAKEIQAARDRADAASQAMWDAQSRLDVLEVEIAEAEQRLAQVESEADAMRSSLEQDALRSFVNSGTGNPLLVDLERANAGITAQRQAAVARGAASVELDDFDQLMKDVEAQRRDLERQRERTTASRAQFEDLKAAAEAEVLALAEIERRRLADVAVQRELERQQRIRREQQAAATAASATTARQTAAPTGGSAPSAGGSGASTATAPDAPVPAPAPPPPSNAGSGIVCPVAGPRAFGDTWGAPRSGGRSHEGVDMMSPAGTPLVAVESGSVQFKTTRLGGNSVWLNGNGGTRYFYAHLSAWEGSSRGVAQGDVIGYVGATGNTTTNHLHFEVHPGGGRAVNPYPYVRAVC
jgi:murein DD-endopeptidase MepM/ murein hydrolase activator NlpD